MPSLLVKICIMIVFNSITLMKGSLSNCLLTATIIQTVYCHAVEQSSTLSARCELWGLVYQSHQKHNSISGMKELMSYWGRRCEEQKKHTATAQKGDIQRLKPA